MAYDDYYDPSVAAASRPLQGYQRHTLSDSSTRQLQTPYLDPHRSPTYEDQDPVYRGNTPQFHGTGPEQLQLRKPDPFDPTGQGPKGQRTYEQREAMAEQKIAGLDPSAMRSMTEQGLAVFGEVSPLMQARGKNQLQKAVMDKITGKMQLEASRKMVELGFKQFNKAADAAKKSAFGLKMATQNSMIMGDKIPSSSLVMADALSQVQDQDTESAETLLNWMSESGELGGKSAIEKASTELTSAQESLAGDVANVGVSLAREAGRGQSDVGAAATRTAATTAGAKMGAAAGTALGAMTGPAAPIAAPVLGFIGGMLGGAGGSSVGKSLAPVAGQMGAQEISRPAPGLGKMPTMDDLMEGGQ